MPNFRERDPSKIAAGFGGTLNLVAGLLFLLLILGLMAVPWHMEAYLTMMPFLSDRKSEVALLSEGFIGAGVVLGLLAGIACVVLPLRAGIRALHEMEF